MFTLIYGAAFLVLGLLVRKRSIPALAIAMIILLADTVFHVYLVTLMDASDAGRALWGLVFRGLLLLWMWPGVAAIRELEERDAN